MESTRRHWGRAAGRFAVVLPLTAASLLGAATPLSTASAAPVTGAVSTTTNTVADGDGHCANGNEAINCNQYGGKQYVWLSGLPDNAGVGDGTYFFAVTVPGGQGNNITANPNDGTDKNLSDTTAAPWSPGDHNADGSAIPSGDSFENRKFTVTNGVIGYEGTHDFANNKIRLMPYDDTTNPGGVYIMAVCKIADGDGAVALDPQHGLPGVNPSECKYDAFMVKTDTTTAPAKALTVIKDAAGTYTKTYGWDISKDVDRSDITQSSTSATVNYAVGVNRHAGTVSDVKVTGKITVINPNAAAVEGVNVSDTLSDGTTCAVTGGTNTLVPFGRTDFSYTCDLGSSLPSGPLSNVVSVDWGAQDLGTSGFLLGGTAAFQFDNIAFKSSDVNDCVNVTDSYAGALGQVCGDTTLTYSRTVGGTSGTCTTFDNTATIVQTGQAASAKVKLCVGADLAVSKTADPTFTRDYGWTIGKDADKTLVKQVGGTATFNYTVKASQTGVTDSKWAATGAITINNPNDWESVDVTSLTDLVDNGGACTINPSVSLPLTVAKSSSATVTYACTFAGGSSGINAATAGWNRATASTPDDSATGTAGFAFTTPTTRLHQTVTVQDAFNGTAATTLGTLTGKDSAPFAGGTYSYPRTVNVPTWDCVTYPNTAKIVETGQDASRTVRVCGPAKTGALTMGFWQNKNGQGIVTGGATLSGVCKSGTWLRGYAPFQNLSSTASCAAVGTYVTNVIKAASAAGTSMNPMLKSQMLATSLDVYFSDSALGGNKISAPKPIGGVTIDLTKICKMIDGTGGVATCPGTYENVSPAFGGASSLTVSQMLTSAAGQSNAGGSTWYANVKTTQGLAKDAFDAINNQVAFAP